MPNGIPPTELLPLTVEPGEEGLEDQLALCLSGGGYRAMLFHLGVLWYLNDAGYLPQLARISSVSGGSITAGVLATRWSGLAFDAGGRSPQFAQTIVAPVRRMAGTTIDVGSVLAGMLLPGTASDRISGHYRRLLFGDLTLQRFPEQPRFIVNATNVGTGSLFRFSRPYLADWRIGLIRNPTTPVAAAVAASSAFPPFLSPAQLAFQHGEWSELNEHECGRPPFTTRVVLTDGGVYDNLGIETAWKRCRRVLVSDAGGRYQADPAPHNDWVRHSLRVEATIDNQVRSLRKRQIVQAFRNPGDGHRGAYWGMWTAPSEYPAHTLPIDDARGLELARTPTRLAALAASLQDRIVNFGYGMAERAIRSFYDPAAFEPAGFPCPGGV
jgi:NTE family protein